MSSTDWFSSYDGNSGTRGKHRGFSSEGFNLPLVRISDMGLKGLAIKFVSSSGGVELLGAARG
jgi:hypothetical protein